MHSLSVSRLTLKNKARFSSFERAQAIMFEKRVDQTHGDSIKLAIHRPVMFANEQCSGKGSCHVPSLADAYPGNGCSHEPLEA